ncbi:hypothetical protein ABI59_07805 [Acidobacteria bacterium Mor1]|nr:hypothetical protein ABI59_07805 [Acidobacteria bacterium Mor1]
MEVSEVVEQADSRVASSADEVPSTEKTSKSSKVVRIAPRVLHGLALKALRVGNRGRLALCEAMRSLDESAGYLELGFSSIASYAESNLHLRRAECFEYLRVSRSLLQLPALKKSFARGRISWSVLKAVTRAAKPASEAKWLEFLAERGAEQTVAEAREAHRAGRDAPRRDGFGLPNLHQRMVLRFQRSDMEKVRRWLEAVGQQIQRKTGAAELRAEDVLLFLSEQHESGGPAEAGHRDSAKGPSGENGLAASANSRATLRSRAKVIYQHCPRCRRSTMGTRDGMVEVEPEVVERRLGDAEIVAIDGPTPAPMRRKILGRELHRCGNPRCSRRAEHCHHIVFRSKGGETSMSNEVAVCRTCHALIHSGLLRVQGRVAEGGTQGLRWTPAVSGRDSSHDDDAAAFRLPVWIAGAGGSVGHGEEGVSFEESAGADSERTPEPPQNGATEAGPESHPLG